MKYLNLEGLWYFWQILKQRFLKIESQLPSTISGYALNTATGSIELYAKNLNTIITSGFYNAMQCQNAKYEYSTLLVIGYYLSGYCTQIQFDVTTGDMATRSQINYSWTDWKVIS